MKNGLTAIRGNTIVGKIADFLRHEITATNYQPGSHLKESQISAKFGVSRVPVREAFRLLQSEGFLEVIPNRGSFVKPISLTFVKETSIVYKKLAPVLLEKAIPNYKESTYKKAYNILGRVENSKDITNVGYLLWDFAKVIYGPSKQEFMLCIFDEIYSHSIRLLGEFIRNSETKQYKVESHYKFLELCKEGKKDEAIKHWEEFLGNMSDIAINIAKNS